MVAELTTHKEIRVCPRCEGTVVDYVLPPEKLRCLDCGWRLYDVKLSPKTTAAEGRRIRLNYDGARVAYSRFKPLVGVILPGAEKMLPAYLELMILCPICREDNLAAPMRRVKDCGDEWVCGAGHPVELQRRSGGREFGSWR